MTLRLPWRLRTCTAVVAAVAVAVAVAAVVLGRDADTVWVTAANLLQSALAAIAAEAARRTARASAGRERLAWSMIAGGAAAWVVGQTILAVHDLGGWTDGGQNWPANVAYLSASLLWAGGLLTFVSTPAGMLSQVRGALEGLMIASGVFMPGWLLVLRPISREASGPAGAQAINLVFAVLGILVLAAALFALSHHRAQQHGSLPLVAGGMAAVVAADAVYWYLNSTDRYHGVGLVDVGWVLGLVLITAGTRLTSPRGAAEPARVHMDRWWFTAIPSLVFGSGVMVAVGSLALSDRSTELTAETAGTIAMIALGGAHLNTVMRENSRLTSGLEQRVRARTEELAVRERYFSSLVRSSSDILVVLEPDMRIRWVSDSARAIYGLDPGAFVGRLLPDAPPFAPLAAACRSGTDRLEWELPDSTGRRRWAESTITDLRGDPDARCIVINTRDVTDRVELESQLRHQALHDPLTGLPNRALFADRAVHATARSDATTRRLAVAVIDIDGFKNVNDSHGHHVGDMVLRHTARRLHAHLGDSHTVARLGGDEFAVLIEDLAHDDVGALADDIASVLRDTIDLGGVLYETRGSVGLAVREPGAGGSVDDLLRDADIAMYQAKRRRPGEGVVFTPDMHHAAQDRFELEGELRAALDSGQLLLHYQPTYRIGDGGLEGFEALVRWRHPQRGLIFPERFIPIAEESGLIVPLGEWALRSSIAQLAAWRGHGELTMAVNVSVGQLGSDRIVDVLGAALRDAGVAPAQVVLEVTESMLIDGTEQVEQVLRRLAGTGVRIAIDDFGTGYASLANLQRLPLDVLKIDRRFVSQSPGPERDQLLASIVDIAHSVGLAVVGEGVEHEEQLAALRTTGCELAQGFHLGRPAPADDIDRLLSQRRERVDRGA